jgi:hypothetical protein
MPGIAACMCPASFDLHSQKGEIASGERLGRERGRSINRVGTPRVVPPTIYLRVLSLQVGGEAQ